MYMKLKVCVTMHHEPGPDTGIGSLTILIYWDTTLPTVVQNTQNISCNYL